jgi:aspartate oxidase
VSTTKTVKKASKKVLKFDSGNIPFDDRSTSLLELNLTLYANHSIPRIEYVKIKTSSKTEKVLMSLSVKVMILRSF